jgi:hypothetical protein
MRRTRHKLTFGLLIATAIAVAACGRQVTPDPPNLGAGGALPGQVAILFDVAAPFNFSNYQYWIIFNTSGDGATPSTLPIQNNWAGYSAGVLVAGVGGATSAHAYQFLKNASHPQAPPFPQLLITQPQDLQYNVNSNGTGSEFSIILSRNIFQSPGPSPSPLAVNWTYNAFTTQGDFQNNLTFIDSMGAGGPVAPQYPSPTLNTSQCFDQTFYAYSSGLQIDPPALIESVEISNNPTTNPC